MDGCDAAAGCTATNADGVGCDDDNPCTTGDSCGGGACQAGSAKACASGKDCVVGECSLVTGKCAWKNAPAGKACDDGSLCTSDDGCDEGQCAGKKVDCDDASPCTNDACKADKGCTHTAKTGDCDDGSKCTEKDACAEGKCVGTAVLCSDDDPCTDDACDAAKGCTYTPNKAPCDDKDACTDKDTCADGKCAGAAITCDDANPCTTDACLPASGCTVTVNDKDCDDGDSCTEKDACVKGKCVGTAKDCDDGNPCTTDSCEDKVGCAFAANTKACASSDPCVGGMACKNGKCQGGVKKDCDDKDPCTADSCDPKTGCVHAVGGATAGKPCDDGNPCTKDDKCDDKAGKCSGTDTVCDAGTPCLKGACDPKIGKCSFTANDGAACDNDGTACTADTCKTGKCLAGPKKDCNTGNVCVVGSCVDKTGKCDFQSKDGASCSDGDGCTDPDLCKGTKCIAGAPKSCDDKSACTTDKCDSKTGKCVFTPLKEGDACDNLPCQDKQTCKAGKCQGGQPKNCDDGDKCTIDSCDVKTGKCAHVTDDKNPACCNKQPWLEDFEKELKGWKSDPPVQGVAWSRYTFSKSGYTKSGKSALKLGAPKAETFSGFTSSSKFMWIEGGSVTVPAGKQASLTVDAKIDITGYYANYHRLYVYAKYKGRNFLLASIYGKPGQWQTVTKDISALAGKAFSLRIGGRIYGTSFSSASGVGIVVDDIRVTSTCKTKTCAYTSQCGTLLCLQGTCSNGTCSYVDNCCQTANDCKTDICTTATCSFYACQYKKKPNCCAAKDDCDDNNPCTVDACPAAGGPCSHTKIKGCCLSNSQCNDNNACTVDACKSNKCSHTNACCKDAGDCDDGDDKCTKDTCESGKCKHTPTGAQGCCTPEVAAWHFNDAKQADGFTFSKCKPGSSFYFPSGCQKVSGTSPTQGWQVWTNAMSSTSPAGALYYGDPKSNTYNFGASAGTVRTPVMKVPAKGKSTVEFQIWWHHEASYAYDRNYVSLWVDGKRLYVPPNNYPKYGYLWYANMSGYNSQKQWKKFSYDVSAHAGKSIQLEFYFNSVDAASNVYGGVLVDDIKLLRSCK